MRLLPVLLLVTTSCATTTTTTTTVSPADAARDATAMLAAAEAAHQCAAEDADDDHEATAFAACIATNTAQAQALLPRVKAAGVIAPGPLAAVRLFLDDVSSAERATVCGALPAGDFLPSQLDDEAHARCGN